MIVTCAISQNWPKKLLITHFLLFADFTQCIIEAFCQSSSCRQCMINWALVEPARVNWAPHLDHRKKKPSKPIQMAILGLKIYRFGLRDPDFVQGNGIFNFKNIYEQFKWAFRFLPRSQCGDQFALVGWTWPTIEPQWKSQSFWGQLQNIIDTCSVLRASPPHTFKNPFSFNLAAG